MMVFGKASIIQSEIYLEMVELQVFHEPNYLSAWQLAMVTCGSKLGYQGDHTMFTFVYFSIGR